MAADALRRPSDVAEQWLNRLLMVLLLLGVPVLAFAAGSAAYTSELRTARSQAAERHQVTAHLTEDAGGAPVTRAGEDRQRAPVRWTEKNGAARTGVAEVPPGTEKGETVRVWVDRAGKVTTAPLPSSAAMSTGWTAGAMTAAAGATVVWGTRAAIRRALDHRRCAQWEKEWDELEPVWSRRLPG
ncbi:Rv1733c family protein [Streptomyces sp. P1-3]|uniref:Rv1733c family protein n=1 Tax=Streptomyces sp. P1-3 TaxID=3421658 RepID=UPI003D36B39E